MKNIRSTLYSLGFLLLCIFTISCKDSPKDNLPKTESDITLMEVDSINSSGDPATIKTPNNGDNVINAYLNLKNALMEDETETTKKLARRLIIAFKEIDVRGFPFKEQAKLREILDTAVVESTHISGSDLVHQREHFNALSENVLQLVSIVGTTKTLYQDFCPMYNDGKGAVWISETRVIKNPYYGAGKMLHCGSIQEVIN